MEYREALAYIHGFQRFGVRLGLERVRSLLDRLGRPHDGLRVVHVGGTNGKGSVSAMLASIFQAAGLRTGLYISPYVEDFRERIQVNRQFIAQPDLARLVSEVRPAVEAMVAAGEESPTEFELITAVAFLYFARQAVDVVVLEVGLGGRYDATNVVADPLASVITQVALDHTDRLGQTVGEIAGEKAGIIKPGGVTVTSATDPDALAVVESVAREQGNRLFRLDREYRFEERSASYHGSIIHFEGPLGRLENVYVYLLGRHQQQNAAAAICACQALSSRGLDLGETAIRAGLQEVRWPGRLEVMSWNPMAVIDGAHNPAAAATLARALEDLFPWTRLVLVLGVLADKDAAGIVKVLAPLAGRVVCTRPPGPRAMAPEALAALARNHTRGEVLVAPTVGEALERGLDGLGRGELLCITGSLYLVGEARPWLRERLGTDQAAVSPEF